MSYLAMFAVPMQAWHSSELGDRDEMIDAHPPPVKNEAAENPFRNERRLVIAFMQAREFPSPCGRSA